MAALVTSFTTSVLRGYFIYAAFAIAISGLTLLTVPVMCVFSLDKCSKQLTIAQALPFTQPQGSFPFDDCCRTRLLWCVCFFLDALGLLSRFPIGLLWVLWLAVGGTIGNISWINYCSSLGFYCTYGDLSLTPCINSQL
jgi:hypothetical protein